MLFLLQGWPLWHDNEELLGTHDEQHDLNQYYDEEN